MGKSIPDSEDASILMGSLPMIYAGETLRLRCSASESGRTETRDRDLERRLSA